MYINFTGERGNKKSPRELVTMKNERENGEYIFNSKEYLQE